jgi:hypothetical protein
MGHGLKFTDFCIYAFLILCGADPRATFPAQGRLKPRSPVWEIVALMPLPVCPDRRSCGAAMGSREGSGPFNAGTRISAFPHFFIRGSGPRPPLCLNRRQTGGGWIERCPGCNPPVLWAGRFFIPLSLYFFVAVLL